MQQHLEVVADDLDLVQQGRQHAVSSRDFPAIQEGPAGLEVAVKLLQHPPQRSHVLEAVRPLGADVLHEGGEQLRHAAGMGQDYTDIWLPIGQVL